MSTQRYNILAMLPRDVVDALPHPCAPERAHRVEEELLKVVDIPQGKYVLRATRAHNHHFFHVETLRKRP